MRGMTGREQYNPRPPRRRWRTLLVLGLLAGLLGMHALAPAMPVLSHDGHDLRARVVAAAHCCHDGCCDGSSGHIRHADPTCASDALQRTPVLPGLTPCRASAADRERLACTDTSTAHEGGCAPLSLAELQLLRI
ncbi:DUF6153 family protein [Streptomyces sp. NPDC053542]|uniref:DUF6153 family protein n=1 Tax=Streptomyces sp. NPDC053542 TaxID=3365710 RepID=UPI0037D1AD38